MASVQKNPASTADAAPLYELCPEIHSGEPALPPRGFQVGSATVSGFPSRSACGMACAGRQCRLANLVPTVATVVSDRVIVSSAINRAESSSESSRLAETVSAIFTHSPGGWSLPAGSDQNWNVATLSGAGMAALPSSATSANAAA